MVMTIWRGSAGSYRQLEHPVGGLQLGYLAAAM
jgi:hypothetical protein